MNEGTKQVLIVALTGLLLVAVVVGGVAGFRWVKQQDTREVTNFSITVSAPPGFECYVQESDHKAISFVLNCTKE